MRWLAVSIGESIINISVQNMKANIDANLKIIHLLIFLFGFSFSISQAQDYQLVWADEFDGEKLDESKWEYQLGNGPPTGWGNNEKEYYTSENAVVDSGFLTIFAKEENYSGFSYTSARIRTRNKGDWQYGKIEIRAKMPFGQGIWPAIWMLPTDNVYGGWAASGEIDVMEYLGHETNKVHGTLHYGGSWPNNKNSGSSYILANNGFNDDFHTFTIIWEEGKFQWLIDGELYQTQTNWFTESSEFPAPFDQRFHLLLNLAVGGYWPGDPDATTTFPQNFVIDYVRVSQKIATGIQKKKDEIPVGIRLNQNYPNPFNSQTIIQYEISEPSYIRLLLFDTLGRSVGVLVNKYQYPGVYSVSLDAANLSSGIYVYSLSTGNKVISRNLVLIK